jgi:hypothetical protein
MPAVSKNTEQCQSGNNAENWFFPDHNNKRLAGEFDE